jgi:hypothetical protein
MNKLGYALGVKLALSDASMLAGDKSIQAGTTPSWLPQGELKLPKNVKPEPIPPDTERSV